MFMSLRPLFTWLVSLLALLSLPAFAESLALPENLISLNSPRGEQLLFSSDARADYLPLTHHFVTQANLAYCGVASSVMVLNALGADAPKTGQHRDYRFFNQTNFFNAASEAVIPAALVQKQGMTLKELEGLLASQGLDARRTHGADISIEDFRQLAIDNLASKDNYLLVNYLRKTIGQERGGHISPLAAYHAKTDRFLILDVSRYKYPSIWVKTEELWAAINTLDSTSGKTRGLVEVALPEH